MRHILIYQIPTIFDYFVTNYHQLLPTYIKMKLSLTPLYTISSTLSNISPPLPLVVTITTITTFVISDQHQTCED